MRVTAADQLVIKQYPEATIYSLVRKKAQWSVTEKITEAAIFLFTPFINGLEQANALSDLGIYYLVEMNNRQLLVRVPRLGQSDVIEEKDITGEFSGNEYIVGKDKFKKHRVVKKRM